MSRFGYVATIALSIASVGAAAQTAGGVNGVPQVLTPHKAAHAAPVSRLAPATVLPNAAAGLGMAYGGTPTDVTLYHYDNYRTGWNPTETDLTPASVSSGNFGLLATLPVDGNVYAQPLLLTNVTTPADGLAHDVLIIATGNNSVYAYDARSYALLWQVNLGRQQSSSDVGCDDVHVGYGISSTPVIVRSATGGTIYLVAATEPTPYSFHGMLHALDITTGADSQPPVEIHPSVKLKNKSTLSFDPQNQWNRASLAYNYNNNSIYIGIGSHCDNNPYAISGWLLRYNTSLQLQKAFNTIAVPQGYQLSSIWMTGFAPAIDPAGNVFVVTGNGDFTGPTSSTNPNGGDWGESVLKLPYDLSRVSGYFTPNQYNGLNSGDTDFGSGGVMLLPPAAGLKTPMAAAMGKAGILYLLNQQNLGKVQASDAGALDKRYLGGGLWGGPAYYNGPSGPTVLAQVDGDVLRSFKVTISKNGFTGGTTTPHFVPGPTGTTGAGYGGSLPIVSSNGATPGTGVVWLVRRSAPIELEAYDAANLGDPIYSANIGGWSNPNNNNPFLTAMEANGRVYVASYLTVRVFGLTP